MWLYVHFVAAGDNIALWIKKVAGIRWEEDKWSRQQFVKQSMMQWEIMSTVKNGKGSVMLWTEEKMPFASYMDHLNHVEGITTFPQTGSHNGGSWNQTQNFLTTHPTAGVEIFNNK